MTGTVFSGSLKVGDVVEIAHLGETRKIKSIQAFKKPIQSAMQGDRVGVCVSQLDASHLERCIVSSPGAMLKLVAGIFDVCRISYFKSVLKNKSKFHISIGHELTMGKCTFFMSKRLTEFRCDDLAEHSNFEWFDEVPEKPPDECQILVFIEFSTPVLCNKDALMIASRLDADINKNACRLAFYGHLLFPVLMKEGSAVSVLRHVKAFKRKQKSGVIERQHDEMTLIASGLFKKETNLGLFSNLKVTLSTGEAGIIEGGFGSSGKVRIRLLHSLTSEAQTILKRSATGKRRRDKELSAENIDDAIPSDDKIVVTLAFCKYLFCDKSALIQ